MTQAEINEILHDIKIGEMIEDQQTIETLVNEIVRLREMLKTLGVEIE